MPTDQPCDELNRIRLEAVAAFQAARATRRAKDLSFQEDVELSRDEHRKIDDLLKHLLSGHDGLPCPAGDRPIIGVVPTAKRPVIKRNPSPRPFRSFRPLASLQRRG